MVDKVVPLPLPTPPEKQGMDWDNLFTDEDVRRLVDGIVEEMSEGEGITEEDLIGKVQALQDHLMRIRIEGAMIDLFQHDLVRVGLSADGNIWFKKIGEMGE